MDTSLLNLGEHFSTCYVYEESNDQSNSDDNHKSYFNDWEDERELNGDIGLIPESSSFCESLKDITDSPPSLLFQKMIDWSNFIFVDDDEVFSHDSLTHQLNDDHNGDIDERILQQSLHTLESNDTLSSNFDLRKYIDEPIKNIKVVKSTGKKIDKEAQKYIIDDENDKLDTSDEVDVETVLDGASLPVLEANDAFSLLEQFEANEKPILTNTKNNVSNRTSFGFSNSLVNNIEMAVNQIPTSPIEIFEKVPQAPVDIFEEGIINSDKNKTENSKKLPESVLNKKEPNLKPQVSDSNTSQGYVKNKQILDALPQELIARINESGKRKPITVIPPIPNKKRALRFNEITSHQRIKITKTNTTEQIQFDHDYCVASSPYPKEPQKDSGFQSSEEDDRSILRNQPTVKTADGKLMVSLLKVNTIRSNSVNINNQKKKLNLEEYKKRRLINSNAASQDNSPASSTCSSPLPEDENLKRIKHQEKLMKMAEDLLKTPAKSTGKPPTMTTPKKIVTQTEKTVNKVAEKIVPPPDLEVKTYVSTATNTEVSSINCSKTILQSAQQLEEIKPLLKKVSDKINSSSFITSLIENIPKVKTTSSSYIKPENQEVVREDKIIHYLKKDRSPVRTSHVCTQTDFDSLDFDTDTQSRYRRRNERGSSSSSSRSSSRSTRRSRRRDSSASSRRSRSSRSTDSSSSHTSRSSRSRSRSFSPKRSRQYSAERLREVEERRVIYVGRITKGTTKEDLRRRFLTFGPITNVSLHFREYGDNYGFVTFANKEDAYEAVEHGNDGHAYPKYDLSFGGRRIFCKTSYSDLDNMREDDYSYYTASTKAEESSFDALLRAAQEKLRKRKS